MLLKLSTKNWCPRSHSTVSHHPARTKAIMQEAANPGGSAQQEQQGSGKRKICSRCSRPARVCVCESLPAKPLQTKGHVVVLQHPHELKKALATVPLLRLALDRCSIVVGRRFKVDHLSDAAQLLASTQADVVAHDDASSASVPPLYVLFPGEDAVPVDALAVSPEHTARMKAAAAAAAAPIPSRPVAAQHEEQAATEGQVNASEARDDGASSTGPPAYVLLAVDGTWQQAKEMMQTIKEVYLPPKGKGIQVCLPATPTVGHQQEGQPGEQAAALSPANGAGQAATAGDASQLAAVVAQDKLCLIRKEPVEGYMVTYEAVARAAAALEGQGTEFVDMLLAPLKMMTALQAQFDPSTRDRIAGKREQDSEWVKARNRGPNKQAKHQQGAAAVAGNSSAPEAQ